MESAAGRVHGIRFGKGLEYLAIIEILTEGAE
jgi:hypothetical protein